MDWYGVGSNLIHPDSFVYASAQACLGLDPYSVRNPYTTRAGISFALHNDTNKSENPEQSLLFVSRALSAPLSVFVY